MGLEYDALLRNNTWDLVPSHPKQTIVHSKWIFRTKVKANGTLDRYKARIVAKGFQQTLGVDFLDTFSPVIKASIISIILTIAVTRKWEIHHIDVNNTFLNGDLQEIVFRAQPEGFVDPSKPTHVCRLRKALYGLKQAPRAWFDKLKFTFHRWGFQSSVLDSSMFFLNTTGSLMFLMVYVDDILITGDDSASISRLIRDLDSSFALKNLGPVRYFLGFEVEHSSTGLHLHQSKYSLDLLRCTNMVDAKPNSTPICLNSKLALNDSPPFNHLSLYRSTIGALQYLTNTRPDISFAVSKLSQFLHSPTVAHWMACKKVLCYIKDTLSFGLSFHPAAILNLEGFSDADWACNVDDRKSMSGVCVFLGGNLITWSSRK